MIDVFVCELLINNLLNKDNFRPTVFITVFNFLLINKNNIQVHCQKLLLNLHISVPKWYIILEPIVAGWLLFQRHNIFLAYVEFVISKYVLGTQVMWACVPHVSCQGGCLLRTLRRGLWKEMPETHLISCVIRVLRVFCERQCFFRRKPLGCVCSRHVFSTWFTWRNKHIFWHGEQRTSHSEYILWIRTPTPPPGREVSGHHW